MLCFRKGDQNLLSKMHAVDLRQKKVALVAEEGNGELHPKDVRRRSLRADYEASKASKYRVS
jgi:hypothetical protein